MTVESVTYVNDLNTAYPATGDVKSEGDDHIRNIKSALKTTFPGLAGRFGRNVAKSGAGPHTVATTDANSFVTVSHTSTVTLNLPAAATAGSGFSCFVVNIGTGAVTMTPASGQINGAANKTLPVGAGGIVLCDGSNYRFLTCYYTALDATSVGGYSPATAATASTLVARDGNADAFAREFSGARMSVTGDGSRNDIIVYDRNLGGSYWQVYRVNTDLFWINSSAGQDRFIMSGTGNFYADGDVVAFYSDERLKDNIQNLKYRAQDVWHMRPVSFEWKDHRLAKTPGKRAIGFIAQEVQQWCPEAVEEQEDPRTPGETYLWVNYDMLVAVAFQLIKDLENQIRGLDRFILPRVESVTVLEKRIEALEARLEALGAKDATE